MIGRVQRQSVIGGAACIMLAAAAVPAIAGQQTPVTAPARTAPDAATIAVNTEAEGPPIHKDVYGQFSEHLGRGVYGGLWVGRDSKIPNTRGFRNDVVAALKALEVPLLRWPGGCFADKYDWRDGIGPAKDRPRRVNTAWGDIPETNAVGTHEFMDLLRQIGADAYVAGNMGSASPTDMAQWIEYMTSTSRSTLADERRENGSDRPFRVDYFGIGNEMWGCGGNMTGERAAELTKQFSTFLALPAEPRTIRVAAGPNVDDYKFTEAMMRDAGPRFFDALSLHHYTFPIGWEKKGQALGFDEKEWANALRNATRMEELIVRHSAIMDRYDPERRVSLAVDEWGAWYDAAPGTDPNLYFQQNSVRDAMIAALNFNIFHRHSGRVRMATIAQMINVDQAMILTDGPRMLRTPTYWVFHMYKPFKGAAPLNAAIASPRYKLGDVDLAAVDASVARGADGKLWMALVNIDPRRAHQVRVSFTGVEPRGAAGQIITGPEMDSHNSFDEPDRLTPQPFSARAENGRLVVDMPAKSVVVVEVQE